MDTKHLPIRQHAADILDAVAKNDVVVVIGETGSGKTTQLSQVRNSSILVCRDRLIPLPTTMSLQILLDAGYASHGMIGVTQPRRVVRITAAARALSGTAAADVSSCHQQVVKHA